MSNMKGKKKPILEVFLILSTVMVIIVGCTPYIADNRNGNGVVFVAPLGSPPADAIAWAPIQDKILVTAGDVGEGRAQVYTIDLKAAKKNILFMTDYGDVVASTWSPDGRRVLILARKQTIGTGAAGLWILDVQNKSLEYLLNSGSAAWSPDGKTIATLSVEDINTASEKIVLSLIDVNTKLVTKIYENVKMRDFLDLLGLRMEKA